MKYLFIFLMLLICGCEFVAPNTSKAISENKQFLEQQRQTAILTDIANSLRTISKNSGGIKSCQDAEIHADISSR